MLADKWKELQTENLFVFAGYPLAACIAYICYELWQGLPINLKLLV